MEVTENVGNQIDSASICEITSVTGCSKTEVISIYNYIKNHHLHSSQSSTYCYPYPVTDSQHCSSTKNLAAMLSHTSSTTKNDLFGGKSLEIFQKTEILQRYTVYQVLHQLLHSCNQNSNITAPAENISSNRNHKPQASEVSKKYIDVPSSSIITNNLPQFPQRNRKKSVCSLSTSRTSSQGSARVNIGCSFCRTNNEAYAVYTSHLLFDKQTNILQCPVLRKLVCPLCGSTGDNAHTLSYCPLNSSKVGSKPIAMFTHINNSSRLASGKQRL